MKNECGVQCTQCGPNGVVNGRYSVCVHKLRK